MKILVINGPNLNMLGLRDKNNYGNLTLKEINKKLRELAKNKAKLKFYQSNCEGKLVSFIQKHLNYDALIINAGAYTHTSLAIHDALELFKGKIMEVHLSNIKETSVEIGNIKLNLAIINGTNDARKIIEKIKNKELSYDFIEVMTCEGGCIAGGGQPRVHFPVTDEVKLARIRGLYKADVDSNYHTSDENEDIIRIYREFLGKPLGEKSHQLLHTTYVDRSSDLFVRENR